LSREESDNDESVEQTPYDIQVIINRVAELDELHEAGATFAYPDALQPDEWAGLRALQRARWVHRKRDEERQKDEQEVNERAARLQQLAGH
jgi:hypothetical protein